ncbi:MAG: OmpA family protein [Planctomycetes bacterium]|nr:OmpA family protein [Planctomycetota bacterium]
MRTAKILSLIAIVLILFLSGCTNWEKKYQALNVEHQNVKGLLDREKLEKTQLAKKATQDQQTIEELQSLISDKQQTPAVATGFGEGYNAAFDPRAGMVRLTLSNEKLFNPGKATLKKSTIVELDHILSVIQTQHAGRHIDIIGHTDSDPIKKSRWKDNWELSAQRSLAVTRYLINHGIAEDRIRSIGCGASRPVTSNETKSGKARNRRVEIIVYMR